MKVTKVKPIVDVLKTMVSENLHLNSTLKVLNSEEYRKTPGNDKMIERIKTRIAKIETDFDIIFNLNKTKKS